MRPLTADEISNACVAGGSSITTVTVIGHRYQASASVVSRHDFGSSFSSPPPVPPGNRHQTPGNNSYVTKVTLSAAKLAVIDAIVDYGIAHNYSSEVITTVVNDAYRETTLNNAAVNGSHQGLFQYDQATWSQNNETGSITNQADQITAMYHDVTGYVQRYNDNIASNAAGLRDAGLSFGQYTEIKHHAGNNSTNWGVVDTSTGQRYIDEWAGKVSELGFQQFHA